jgi:hypothetical protein
MQTPKPILMESPKDPQLSRHDHLRAENNLLKVKLGLEHNMQMSEISSLPPDVENQWLKSVYAFEEQFKQARRIKVYDYIGRPVYNKWDTIKSEHVSAELQRLYLILENNDIVLSSICHYDDAILYKFITEELFVHEMDDMRIPGMTVHFTYEEFHPNHDYDLRNDSARFLEMIFHRKWEEEYDNMILDEQVTFGGKLLAPARIADIIKTFQEAHDKLKIQSLEVTDVVINADITAADVRASLCVKGNTNDRIPVTYEGICSFTFSRQLDYWHLSGFYIPGFM